MTLDKLGGQLSSEGSKGELFVEDDNTYVLLGRILKQLQIINLHLGVMTDNHFTKEDL